MTNSLTTMESSRELLQNLIDSKKLPAHVKTIEDAFTIAKMGQELGFPIMQALHYVIPIQGKLSLSAKALNALLRKGGVEFITLEDGVFVYDDDTVSNYRKATKEGGPKLVDIRTTIKFFRNGKEELCSFTWKDAENMKLTSKENWKKMPKEMLYARCLAKGANRIGADHLLGLYTTEELFDHTAPATLKVIRDEDGMIQEILNDDIPIQEVEPITNTSEIDNE